MEDDSPRMVNTPWFEDRIPFEEQQKWDKKVVRILHNRSCCYRRSITDLPRRSYIEAEERVIKELKELEKPFIIALNSAKPKAQETIELREALETKYSTTVVTVDALNMEMEDLEEILGKILFEFPAREINFHMPRWMDTLELDHWLKGGIVEGIRANLSEVNRIRDIDDAIRKFDGAENLQSVEISDMRLGEGVVNITISMNEGFFTEYWEKSPVIVWKVIISLFR